MEYWDFYFKNFVLCSVYTLLNTSFIFNKYFCCIFKYCDHSFDFFFFLNTKDTRMNSDSLPSKQYNKEFYWLLWESWTNEQTGMGYVTRNLFNTLPVRTHTCRLHCMCTAIHYEQVMNDLQQKGLQCRRKGDREYWCSVELIGKGTKS